MNWQNYRENKSDNRVISRAQGRLFVALIVILVMASGCFMVSMSEQDRLRKQLEKRFGQFMEIKKSSDVAKAYDMFSPDYRKRVSPFEFPKKEFPDPEAANVTIISYTIETIEFSSHYTEALITFEQTVSFISVLIPMDKPAMVSTKPKMRWVLENGVWYREPKQTVVDVSGYRYLTDQY